MATPETRRDAVRREMTDVARTMPTRTQQSLSVQCYFGGGVAGAALCTPAPLSGSPLAFDRLPSEGSDRDHRLFPEQHLPSDQTE